MNKEELKIWFFDKFNACYWAKSDKADDRYFLIYDINFIRSKKLANILNKEVEYPPTPNGICLFEYNLNKKFIWCNEEPIWNFIQDNYRLKNITQLLYYFFENDYRLNNFCVDYYDFSLMNIKKLKIVKDV